MTKTLPPALAITPPNRPLSGRVSPPGSKSITNRALLLAALAEGTSRLTGALKSKDTVLMARALREMGVTVEEPDATTFLVTSTGRLTAPEGPLFLGNAGTATRFLTAAVATVEGTVIVDGDEDMRVRPIKPLVDALNALGIDARSPTGCPPVTIVGTGRFGKGRVEIDASLSSQYVSALLMAAPFGDGPIEIALAGKDIGARGYVDLTLAAMRAFGADVNESGDGSWLVQPTGYKATDFHIEPDASAATYLWGIEALTGGTIDLGVATEAFTQPDAAAQAVIASFPNMPAVIDGSQMQDAVPTMAVVAAFNNQPVRFVGIANLRVKETDRIRAVANELNRILPGLATEEGDDLVIGSDPKLAEKLDGRNSRIKIETYHDHRIAMSFALAGLLVPNIVILDPACTGKTYPDYWDMLESLGVTLTPA
ncbi:MAG: 3-phosphoshikimate 1-carboxyvinyltransferase [Phyllobacteriaceae bacterium]|nr:3-phosphoshikimate 1-carboxyvinyltransferase [Phyllobacteriaceae bacterium]